jgi:hypothetical protein
MLVPMTMCLGWVDQFILRLVMMLVVGVTMLVRKLGMFMFVLVAFTEL